jgi:hypothetical protein
MYYTGVIVASPFIEMVQLWKKIYDLSLIPCLDEKDVLINVYTAMPKGSIVDVV